MKFKVGDQVKVKKCTSDDCECNRKKGVISEVKQGVEYPYVIAFENDYEPIHDNKYDTSELILIKREKVQYVAIFDENDRDPAKTFSSLLSLRKWLLSTLFNSDIKYGSIRVFEVKNEYYPKNLVSIRKVPKK